ncbi:MAG: M48 family metallopeptidase [candidate division Zixibacteria bacterium]|nr:M48 family metallopeptidase [candidate division Zixibacteria bacterium]
MKSIAIVRIAVCLLVLLVAATCLGNPDSLNPADTVAVDTAVMTADTTVAAATTGDLQYPMDPERQAQLVAYSRFNNIWRFVSFFVGLLIPFLILVTGLSAKLRTWASKIKIKFFAVWAFLILFLLVDYILSMPLSIYRSFIVEQQYGFMNQTFIEWLTEDMMNLGILMVIGIIPMFFLYKLINYMTRWWLAFTLGAIPFLIVMMIVIPIYISPLFNDFGPLQDKALETEILALAESAGIHDADIFEVNASKQSAKLNAYVTGMFGSKRIVLYDTLIRNFTTNEIKFVMAHEMGHYVMNHIWWGLGIALVFMMLALFLMDKMIHRVIKKFQKRFGFIHLGDMASLPLILIFVSVISFVFQPITNSASRYMEVQSDTYGMEHAGITGEEAAIAFDKLAVYNLSDPDPHPLVEFWFYSHPALTKRMAFVRAWEKE